MHALKHFYATLFWLNCADSRIGYTLLILSSPNNNLVRDYVNWFAVSRWICVHYYGRPLSVSGRPCYILPMFFLYFFLWPPYSPALVNGGSRKFYTWWILSVIREVTTWIFSWSSLDYRVGQKVTKFSVFSDRTRKLSALTPERGRIL